MTDFARTMKIEVELPTEALPQQPLDSCRLADDLRVLWLLAQVRRRRLGFGKAAELAELPKARFLQLMFEHHVSPFDYDDEEIERELA